MNKRVSDWVSSKFFKMIHENNLVYNTCWEDPRLDREAMKLGPGDSVMVITSAGCNALDYALDHPQSIHAVDVNPRQNALLELKIAAIKALDFETFFELFGRGRLMSFPDVYQQKIRPLLPGFAQEIWDKKTHYFTGGKIRKTFYRRGTSGFFATVIANYIDLVRVRKSISELFASENIEQQKEYYHQYIKPRFWKGSLKWWLKGDATLALLGVPRSQRELIEKEYLGGVSNFMQDCLESVMTKLPLSDNYFWWLYITGQYERDRCPEYLKEENFLTLKAGAVESITTHTKSVQHFLREHPDQITRYVLLDHMDWLSEKMPEMLREEWQYIIERAAPGARILWRSGGLRVDFVDPIEVQLATGEKKRLGEILCYQRELAQELHKRDRVHTYGSFYIADVAA